MRVDFRLPVAPVARPVAPVAPPAEPAPAPARQASLKLRATDRLLGLAGRVYRFFRREKHAPGHAPRLDAARMRQLLNLAAASPQLAWRKDMPISAAFNAHRTNTFAELSQALAGPYNSLEGDVRWRDGELVMAHDPDQADGLTFREWAAAVAKSGRHLRIDLKEGSTLDAVLREVRALGVPDWQLTINLGAGNPLHTSSVSLERLQALRKALPEAHIGLNLPLNSVRFAGLIQDYARAIGGKVMVAMQMQEVTPARVAMLQPDLIVGVWNDPRKHAVADPLAEKQRLRLAGVDGQIDLRRSGDDPGAGQEPR